MKGDNKVMSTKRKLKEEEGQTKLIGLIKRTYSPNREAKQRTPPSTEKPKSKRINMDKEDNQQCELSDKESQPTPPQTPMNQMAFDLAAMEKKNNRQLSRNHKTTSRQH